MSRGGPTLDPSALSSIDDLPVKEVPKDQKVLYLTARRKAEQGVSKGTYMSNNRQRTRQPWQLERQQAMM